MRRLIALIAASLAFSCAHARHEERIRVAEAEQQQIPWAEVPRLQQAAIELATAWFKSRELDEISGVLPYEFATTSACRPYLTPLEGDHTLTKPVDHQGWWLLTDLETNRFWLLVTMDYFGPAHYFGPATLTPRGELEPLSASEVDYTCVK